MVLKESITLGEVKKLFSTVDDNFEFTYGFKFNNGFCSRNGEKEVCFSQTENILAFYIKEVINKALEDVGTSCKVNLGDWGTNCAYINGYCPTQRNFMRLISHMASQYRSQCGIIDIDLIYDRE